MTRKKRISVIIKPTHDCNLRCRYCYVDKGAENGRMTEQLVEESIRKVSDFAEDSHWIWHGGEPLLMGVDFYSVVQDVQRFYAQRKGKGFSNGIQTNGTLVDTQILDFITRSRDFHVGMSMDGPPELHNATRVYPDGRGSFEDVFRGVQKTRSRRRAGGGVICVVSAGNIDHPQELYDFFKHHNINVKFNPLIKSGRAEENLTALGITPREYGEFLMRLWDIYNEDCAREGRVTIDIDPFLDVIGNIATGKPIGCNYSSSCRDSFISIGPQGDIYPCGRFDGIKEFWMGNVTTHTVEEAVNSEVSRTLRTRGLENVAGCTNCDNGKICNSGCMHNAYCAGDVMGKDPYCASYKTLFSKMSAVLEGEKSKGNLKCLEQKE